MKKRIILLIIFIAFFITGCGDKANNNDINNNKQNNQTEQKEEAYELNNFQKVKINCPELINAADFSLYDSLFITKDGRLFQISYDLKYMNGTNCKEVESEKTFVRFIKAGILDSNNDIYHYNDNDGLAKYNASIGNIKMPNYIVEQLSSKIYQNIIFAPLYIDDNYFYYNSDKKAVYQYILDSVKLNDDPILVLDSDEEIEYFTTGGIKTNKNYYEYGRQIINREQCEKYADFKCEEVYTFFPIEETNIKKQLEHIRFIMHSLGTYIIVDENGYFYTNLSGG